MVKGKVLGVVYRDFLAGADKNRPEADFCFDPYPVFTFRLSAYYARMARIVYNISKVEI